MGDDDMRQAGIVHGLRQGLSRLIMHLTNEAVPLLPNFTNPTSSTAKQNLLQVNPIMRTFLKNKEC
jgi:hypothetical protein